MLFIRTQLCLENQEFGQSGVLLHQGPVKDLAAIASLLDQVQQGAVPRKEDLVAVPVAASDNTL